MYAKRSTPLLVALVSLVAPIGPTRAEIDTQHLGAKYDATRSNITFRVYSSRATRIELDLYAVSYGAPELAKYLLTKDADNVWSVTVPASDLRAAGIGGAVFYGYRAWGPNWPYSSELDERIVGRFHRRRRRLRQPLQSEQAAVRSVCAGTQP